MPYRRRPAVSYAQMLPLECRRLLAAVLPTAHEQYLVELINRGRMNPNAEATRYDTDLNEGLPAGTISSAPKQPLAVNPYITDAARKHSQWMLETDTFSHTGAGGTNSGSRISNAGYAWTTYGENLGWTGSTGSINATTATAEVHRDLYVDAGIAGRGHRKNLMNNSFREIGTGVLTGVFTSGQNYNALMVTEDFAASGDTIFLTGVAYSDGVSNDNFYTPGEGLGGVFVKAVRNTDSLTFQTSTWSSGGYSLALDAGTYTVTASGGALGGTVTYTNVLIGSQNVKRDFTSDNLDAFASITSGKLTVQGTTGVDAISVTKEGTAYTVTRNATSTTLAGAGVTAIDVFGHDGDDYILIGNGVTLGAYIDAGAGNDYIQGGDGDDTITSGGGKDRAFGGLGDDRVAGNGGHDKLYGMAGKDRHYGGEGNDTMEGGSSADRFWGEGGNNIYFGQGGDDRMFARNSLADSLFGQAGIDYAQVDNGSLDYREGIENLL